MLKQEIKIPESQQQHQLPNDNFKITISFPDNSSIQMIAQPNTIIHELKQSICDSPEAHSFTCFQLYYNKNPLDFTTELQNIPESTHDMNFSLIPDYYNEHEIHVHLTRFREIITNFSSPIPTHGTTPSPTLFPLISQNHNDPQISDSKHPFSDYKLDGKSSPLHSLFPLDKINTSPKCLKSMAISPWNPPPFYRKMDGDILYLLIETLDNLRLEITASTNGFFINSSTKDSFNPIPNSSSFHSHNLISLLSDASESFKTHSKTLLNTVFNRNPYEYLSSPYPVYPWASISSPHDSDPARTLDSIMMATDTLETFACRDWNEDLQSAREMPKDTIQERISREQAYSKTHSEFVEACIRGVKGIVQKSILSVNPLDSEFKNMYIHNNIFFSQGYDNHDQYDRYGGEAAAHVAVSKDIDGINWISNLGLDSFFTVGTAVIDYKGTRTVCQSIVPGILKKNNNESAVKYGSADSGNEIHFDQTFHDEIQKFAKHLHLAEHEVTDANGKNTKLFTSIDTKGLVGADGRRYLLDLYRITGMDITFMEECSKDESNPYPHEMTLLRTELVEYYYENKARELMRKRSESKKDEKEPHSESCDHSKPETGETHENSDKHIHSENCALENQTAEELAILDLDFVSNPDSFTKISFAEDDETIKKDQTKIRDISQFLNSRVVAQFLLEMANFPNSIPMDGESLTKSFHSRGINMRYLGKIASLIIQTESTTLMYIKSVCELEMVSRACKHLLRKYLAPIPMSFVSTCISHFFNCLFSSKDNVQLDIPQSPLKELRIPELFESLTCLDLKIQIKKEIKTRFRYEISSENITVSPIALLRGICQKVGIQVLARDYVFASENAFTSKDILNLYPVVKHSEPKAIFADQVLEHGLQCLNNKEEETGTELLREALVIFEQVHGPIHQETARVLVQYAMVLANQGKWEEAINFQIKAIICHERTFGLDSPSALQQYINLAHFLNSNGETKKALNLAHHAVLVAETLFADGVHADRSLTLTHIANMLIKIEDYNLANMFLEKAMEDSEYLYGKDHHLAIQSCEILVRGYIYSNEFREALHIQRRVCRQYEAKLGLEHEKTKEAYMIISGITAKAVEKAKQLKKEKKSKIEPKIVSKNMDAKLDKDKNIGEMPIDKILEYIG